eukprot:1180798-Prorocentrum_minimum.AAC.4
MCRLVVYREHARQWSDNSLDDSSGMFQYYYFSYSCDESSHTAVQQRDEHIKRVASGCAVTAFGREKADRVEHAYMSTTNHYDIISNVQRFRSIKLIGTVNIISFERNIMHEFFKRKQRRCGARDILLTVLVLPEQACTFWMTFSSVQTLGATIHIAGTFDDH